MSWLKTVTTAENNLFENRSNLPSILQHQLLYSLTSENSFANDVIDALMDASWQKISCIHSDMLYIHSDVALKPFSYYGCCIIEWSLFR